MAEIKAFRAVRPRRDLAHLVASRPVATYTKDVLEAKLSENPYTFIRIIHPEFSENKSNKTEPNTIERFNKVKEAYRNFLKQGVFVEDQEETIYIYRQTSSKNCFTGVITGSAVEDYKNDVIKKHEATLTERELMFTNYLDVVGINAEPVLLTHKHDNSIEKLLNKHTTARPEYEFTTTDQIRHELWLVVGQEKDDFIKAYKNLDATYIADGHHRSASSARLADRINEKIKKPGAHNHFLTYLISEKDLEILPFDRVCRNLNGLNTEDFILKLKERFEIKNLDSRKTPNKNYQFSCYLDGKWYSLNLKEEYHPKSGVVSKIDAAVLTENILEPILGISDLKTDKNISFVGGENTLKKIEQKVDSGVFKIGFSLKPVTFNEIKSVADNNEIMPPKSTWVLPKLRSGLTIYNIK